MKSLGVVNAHILEYPDLLGRFHALGNNAGIQAATQGQNAVDNGPLIAVGLQSVDQALVDLEQVDDAGCTQVEAIDSAAEIIQGDQNPRALKLTGVINQAQLFVTASVLDQFQAN